MARINATQMGIMGAFLGGLNFALNGEMQRIKDQADLVKEQRLRAIALETEDRANKEWTRRQEIEAQDQRTRDELNDLRQQRLVGMQQGFQMEQKNIDRMHDLEMVGAREESDLRVGEATSRRNRSDHVYERTFDATLEARMPRRASDKGIMGDDGKFYPFGQDLPPGVKPRMTYGGTFAPSESKSAAPRGTHRGSRTPGTFTADNALGSSEANPKPVTSMQEAAALPPGTWIRLPNGKVGQR